MLMQQEEQALQPKFDRNYLNLGDFLIGISIETMIEGGGDGGYCQEAW